MAAVQIAFREGVALCSDVAGTSVAAAVQSWVRVVLVAFEAEGFVRALDWRASYVLRFGTFRVLKHSPSSLHM